MMAKELIEMKISIDGIEPEIWREFIVDSSISLDDFHGIIQVVMGWENCHLYGFYINGVEYIPAGDDCEQDAEDTKGVKLNKLKLEKNTKIRYTYDFGDSWEHTIKIVKIYKPEEELLTPVCIDGARNCPPEDCGSVPGYEDILKAIKKPTSKAAKELIEWLGYEYNPEEFDIDKINKTLQPKKAKKKKSE
ncbi:MAG TPA: hypothetical protein DCO75_00475 [Fibrobacteres bacterium]|jgi:hypothetical protein|nr:hypothetical protein [Fibrobacterota bacterium]